MTMTAAGLAKLIEECGELAQVLGKKLAFFYTDEHPDGGPPLSLRMLHESADVRAAVDFVTTKLKLGSIVDQAGLLGRLERPGRDCPDRGDPATALALAIGCCGRLSASAAALLHAPIPCGGQHPGTAQLAAHCAEACASIALLARHFQFDARAFHERCDAKLSLFRAWDAQTDNAHLGFDASAPGAPRTLGPQRSRVR